MNVARLTDSGGKIELVVHQLLSSFGCVTLQIYQVLSSRITRSQVIAHRIYQVKWFLSR